MAFVHLLADRLKLQGDEVDLCPRKGCRPALRRVDGDLRSAPDAVCAALLNMSARALVAGQPSRSGIPARDEPHCLGRRVGTATDPRNRRASSLVRVHETGGRSVRVYHQEDDGWRVFRYGRSFAATASWVDLPVGQRGHQRCSDPSGWRLRPASARLTLSRVSGRSAWRSGRDSARSS